MIFDTLKFNGLERTFAAWGFSRDCVGRYFNFKADTFTGTIPRANIGDDPIFPYFGSVIVQTNRVGDTGADNTFSGGTIKFQGKRVANPMKANSRGQGVTYQFLGPCYDLDITQYLQTYKGSTTNYMPGEVVLNTAAFPAISTAGLRFISVGDQIQAILQFVLDCYTAMNLALPFKYVARPLLNGKINLDANGNAGAPNENTDEQGAIYNLQLPANGLTIDRALFKVFLKSDIIRPLSATQAIQKLLASSPRTNLAFDHSTTPPTCYVMNVDNLAAVNLPLFDRTNHKSLDIQRRDDLLPSSVVIGYRITNDVNGNRETDYAVDKWGPHGWAGNPPNNLDPDAGPGVIVEALDLQGFSQTITTASMKCSPLADIGGTQATKRAWWSSKQGGDQAELEDTRVRFQDGDGLATTIPNGKRFYVAPGFDSTGAPVVADQEFTAADYAFYTNRIVEGGHHSWMTLNNNAPVLAVKCKVKTLMTYAEYDVTSTAQNPDLDRTGTKKHFYNQKDTHVVITVTNGITGTYETEASFTPGESFILGPGGIAQYLFLMLSVLQYEGEYVKVEASFSNGVSLLNRLNLTGGRAEWAAMNAQIQEIEEHWGDKTTSVKIGVSKHLEANQLSELLNMWRFRRTWYNPAMKADNSVGSGGSDVEMADTNGNSNTMPGLKNEGAVSYTDYQTLPNGSNPGVILNKIILDPKAAGYADAIN